MNLAATAAYVAGWLLVGAALIFGLLVLMSAA